MHYERWKRTGDPLALVRRVSGIIGDDAARFWFFVDRAEPEGCWLWNGTKAGGTANRYGWFGVGGRGVFAHRFAYELEVGPIPTGHEIDHVWRRGCRSTLCVNPAHLEAVAKIENLHRIADRYEHCPQGHPYDEANTYWRPDGRGKDCLACRRERSRNRHARVRAMNIAAGLTSRGTQRLRH
jgi:hypothetical protein